MGCSSSKPPSGTGVRLATDTAQQQNVAFKVVMMGDKATGKSSLVYRFTKEMFPDSINTTIGAAFASKDVRTTDDAVVRLQIWDTAGEELYRAMTRSFFRDAAAGVIVYDITSTTSFASCKSWLKDFRDACPDSIVVLVGNKADREESRRVSTAEAEAFAAAEGLTFFEVSAKTGSKVSDVFHMAAQTLMSKKRNRVGQFS